MTQPIPNFLYLEDTQHMGVWLNLSLVDTIWQYEGKGGLTLMVNFSHGGKSIAFGGDEAQKLLARLKEDEEPDGSRVDDTPLDDPLREKSLSALQGKKFVPTIANISLISCIFSFWLSSKDCCL
ncbi:MAG: hypothetical protein SVX43_23565, partial [Cyanobacteriota bacterium]|nr:hypothetical protein [Cyanobacteriota bacterium]